MLNQTALNYACYIIPVYIYDRHREIDRHISICIKDTDRQMYNRLTGRETDRQAVRQTERHANRQRDK